MTKGKAAVSTDTSAVDSIIARYGGDKDMLIPILHDVQAEYRHLPREALEHVGRMLDIPLTDVFHVATFFKAFSLEPRGRHTIRVCMGTACHVRGAPKIAEGLEAELGIRAGQTTGDGLFTLETVNCLGCCAIAPVVVADEEYQGQADTRRAVEMVRRLRGTGHVSSECTPDRGGKREA